MPRCCHTGLVRSLLTAATVALLSLSAAAAATQIRVAAANLTSGNAQTYQGPGTRILQALDPDIVLIQEFKVEGQTIDQWVDTTFGAEFSWFREPQTGGIPNGVISRWPIAEAGEWIDPNVSDRDFAWARIDVPGPADLWAVSVHFLTSSATSRNSQATLLRDLIAAEVPQGDFLVVGGDLNTDSRTEAAIATLGAVVVIPPDFPADQAGDPDTNAPRSRPYDWVLADGDLDPTETGVVQGSWTFPTGLVFDTRLFTQAQLDLSFPPALVGDSGAANMQHMAVVRDFLVPGDTPPGHGLALR